MLKPSFFDRDTQVVAIELLGKVIRHRYKANWLSAKIIETEAYYISDKASHSSVGRTQRNEAMFMPPGTIYMYYARGKDSLNISCKGEGNGVLIKSGYPWIDEISPVESIELMKKLNPLGEKIRDEAKLCNGQTLLCKSLGLKVTDWDKKSFIQEKLYIDDVGDNVKRILQTTRLGISKGRDEHLLYRYKPIDLKEISNGTEK